MVTYGFITARQYTTTYKGNTANFFGVTVVGAGDAPLVGVTVFKNGAPLALPGVGIVSSVDPAFYGVAYAQGWSRYVQALPAVAGDVITAEITDVAGDSREVSCTLAVTSGTRLFGMGSN